MALNKIRGVIFDLDGVVYLGNKSRKGAKEIIDRLRQHNYKIHFLTNTCVKTHEEIIKKLESFDISINPNEITTSSEAVSFYLHNKVMKGEVILVFGGGKGIDSWLEQKNIKYLRLEKITIAEINKLTDVQQKYYLVIGWCKYFNYTYASKIIKLESHIKKIISSDNDISFAHNSGKLPGTAWINYSIMGLTKIEPVIIGKPSRIIFNLVLKKLGLKPENVIVIGDNITSDIRPAIEMGISTCFILGGVSSKKDIRGNSKNKPNYIIKELTELETKIFYWEK